MPFSTRPSETVSASARSNLLAPNASRTAASSATITSHHIEFELRMHFGLAETGNAAVIPRSLFIRIRRWSGIDGLC